MDAFYIIMTGTLFSIACSLLGCFLILRKLAMMGDAISHAVLPGIVIAFLLTGSRDSFTMLLGAGSLGIFTSFMIEFFQSRAKLQSDAAIGVSFTSLFAIGIILISIFAGQVDLDQECVLYGEIAYIPLDLWVTESGKIMGPRALYIAIFIVLLVLIFLFLFYKNLHITSFDASFAASIGISVGIWHYLLMGMVSLTTVAAFDSVGAILVVALFVVPPATAYLLSRKLKSMLILSAFISAVNSTIGYFIAGALNASIAGAMVMCAGVLFMLAFLFSPTEGLIVKKYFRRRPVQIH